MKLPQFTLADLLWLMLAAAIGTGWAVDHARATKELNLAQEASPFLNSGYNFGPDEKWQARRRAAARELAALNNLELEQRFLAIGNASDPNTYEQYDPYDPCLNELARRRMGDVLQREYERARGRADPIYLDRNEGELLTALRRAQRQPDPLKIHVELIHEDDGGRKSPFVPIKATLENVDVGRQRVRYTFGDYRGGRLERWRVHLTDRSGRRVPESNYFSFGGDGTYWVGQLSHGEPDRRAYSLDPRSYVASPPSGAYQLEVFHILDGNSIASDPDLTGLIVVKSGPIPVVVANLSHRRAHPAALAFSVLCAIAVVVFGWGFRGLLYRRPAQGAPDNVPQARRSPGWRNLLALVLIVLLAGAWLFDNWRLTRAIERTKPDAEANWTMKLAK